MTNINEIKANIVEIIADCLGLDGAMNMDDSFKDLGADSIDMATLLVTLQDEYPENENIDESRLVGIKTPTDIVDMVINTTPQPA